MLLDGYKGTKFVIPEFDQYFPQTNMSYFYQHLTYTKYIHGLPYSIQYGNVDENKFENFKKFVEQLLFFEHQHNLSYEKIENPFKVNFMYIFYLILSMKLNLIFTDLV